MVSLIRLMTQVYIHFTDIESAEAIKKSKQLWKSSIVSGVYATALGGAHSPEVQLTRLGRAKNRDVAIYFTTMELPDICYPEECIWKQDQIEIHVYKIVDAKNAIKDLDGSLPVENKDAWDERLDIPSKENLKKYIWESVSEFLGLP